MSRNGSLKLAGVALSFASLAISNVAIAGGGGPPPNARPGECYGQVTLPASYQTVSERVLERAARTETRTIPAVVKRTGKRVLVTPERTVTVKTPATWRTEVSYVTKPGVLKTVRTPAKYRTETEKVLVEAGHAEWKRMDAASIARGEAKPGQTFVSPTGEVMCRIWVPDRYEYRQTKVLVSPAKVTKVKTGPRKVKVTKRVQVGPPGTAQRKVPAVYKTQWTTTVIKPARKETVHVPAVYTTVQKKVQTSGGQGWALVFCGGPLVPAFIQQMQYALISRGYDPGPADGYGRPQTYAALSRFQASRGMAQGQVTIESARALGIW